MTKGPDAFRTISEASDELGVPQHVLRFWETRFSFIRPMKRAGGRRFYRPQDLEVLRGVRGLLHDQGYTIKGVQRLHREQGLRRLVSAAGGDAEALANLEAEIAAAADAQPDLPLDDGPAHPDAAHSDPAHSDPAQSDGAPPRDARSPARSLDAAARDRLVAVLEEIEAAKTELDALLAAAPAPFPEES